MSEKLTQEKIENMILEELQKLEEFKVPIKITSKGAKRNAVKNAIGIPNDTDLKTVADASTYAIADQEWKNFAGIAGDTDLEDADFKKAFGGKTTANAKFAQRAYKASNKGDAWWSNIGGKYNPAKGTSDGDGDGGTFPTYSDLLKSQATGSGVVKATVMKKALQTALDALQANKNDTKAMKALKDYLQGLASESRSSVKKVINNIIALFPALDGGTDGGTDGDGDGTDGGTNLDPARADRIIDDTKSLLDKLNTGIGVDDRSLPAFGADIRTQSASFQAATTGPKAFRSRADSSTIEVFRNIDGATLEEKFDNLAKFSEYIQDPTKDLDNFGDGFKIANYGIAYSTIADLARSMGSSPAGTQMEAILALMLEGAQVGGTGAGEDMVQGMDSGRTFYSSKFQGLTGPIDQSWSEGNGLFHILSKANKPVYYVYPRKSVYKKGGNRGDRVGTTPGEEGTYNIIDLFILKCEPDSKAKQKDEFTGGKVSFVDKNGKLQDTGQDWKVYLKKSSTGGTYRFKINVANQNFLSQNAAANLKVPMVDKNNVSNTANAISDALKMSSAKLAKQISAVQKQLTNMQLNTREYSATQKNATSTEKTKYIKQISTDYIQAQKDYKDIFQAGGGVTTSTAFNESKLQTLDQLIAETMRDIKRKRKK